MVDSNELSRRLESIEVELGELKERAIELEQVTQDTFKGLRYLYLVRHGEDEYRESGRHNGRADPLLSSRGIDQARQAGNMLADQVSADVIITSPLTRAMETAMMINSRLPSRLPLVTHDGLIERDMGEITGMTDAEATQYAESNDFPFIITDAGKKIYIGMPGEESFPRLYDRAALTLRDIRREYSGNVIAVTHHMIAVMMIAVASGLTWEDALCSLRLPNTSVYEVVTMAEAREFYAPPDHATER